MELIPEGKYPARAVHWKLSETQTEPKKEQLAVEFQFHVGEEVKTLLWFGFFTEKTFERTIESLRYCGWTGNDVLELDTPQANLNANEVEIVVGHETYKDKKSARIQWVNKKGGVDLVAPLAAEKRASFQQRMKASILEMEAGKRKTSAPRPPAPPAPNGPASLDDVPF